MTKTMPTHQTKPDMWAETCLCDDEDDRGIYRHLSGLLHETDLSEI